MTPEQLKELGITDDRVAKTIAAAVEYAKDPYGDIGHNLKMAVAALVNLLLEKQDGFIEGRHLAILDKGAIRITDEKYSSGMEISVSAYELRILATAAIRVAALLEE